MAHQCPVRRCEHQLPDHILMCKPHWHQTPFMLRRAVWAAYANGAGVGTAELLAAQRDAIDAVNAKAGA